MLPFKFIVYDDTQEFRFWNLWNFFSINFKVVSRLNQRWRRIKSRKYHIVGFFFTFNESLLILSHSAILFNSWFATSYVSSILSPLVKRWVSSANKNGIITLHSFGKSFISIRNNNGPNVDPWGTPHLILVGNFTPVYVTYCDRPES